MAEVEVVEFSLPEGDVLLARATRIGDDDDGGSADVGIRDFLSFSQVTRSIKGLAGELHKALEGAKPDLV